MNEIESVGELLIDVPGDVSPCGYATADLNETEEKMVNSPFLKVIFSSLTEVFGQEHSELVKAELQKKTAIDHTDSETPIPPLPSDMPLVTFQDPNSNLSYTIHASQDIIDQLEGASLKDMEQSTMLTWLFKLALANGHEQSKIAAADSEFKKKTATVLRIEIKDNANSYGWMIWSAVGIAASGGGMIWGISKMGAGAQEAQNALQIGQLGNAVAQPFVQYNQTADQTRQEEARHKQQMVGGDRQNQEQHSSSAEQSQETRRQSMQGILQKRGEIVQQIFH